MAKIQQYTPQDFVSQGQPIVQAPTQFDGTSLIRLGTDLRNQAKKDQYDAAVIEGQNAQMAGDGKTLATKDFGILDRFSEKGFKAGAEAAYAIQKENSIKTKATELEDQFKYDPDGFQTAMDSFRDEQMKDLPASQMAGLFASFDGVKLLGKSRIDQNVIQKGREDQQFTIAQRADEISRQIQNEIEDSGEVSETTKAQMDALQGSMDDAELSNQFKLATQDSWRNATIASTALHQYKTAADKTAVENALLEGTGDWADVPFSEREKALQAINVFTRKENATNEAHKKVLGRQIDDALSVSKSGNSPVDAQTLIDAAIKSGDVDLIDKAQNLAAQEGVRGAVEVYKTMGLDDMEEAAIEIERAAAAKGGFTPQLVAAKEALAKKRGEFEAAQKSDDILSYAQINDGIPDERVDAGGRLLDPTVRQMTVNRARALYRSDVNFYTQDEITQFKNTWENGDANSRKSLIATLTEQTPDDELDRVIGAVAAKNPEMAVVMSSIEAGRHDIADRIVDGGDAQKNLPDLYKGEEWSKAKVSTVQSVQSLFPLDKSGATIRPVADAVTNLMAADIAKGKLKASDVNASTVETYTASLFGVEELPEINGVKTIPFDAGMTPDEHEKVIEDITADPATADRIIKSMASNGTLPRDMLGGYGADVPAEDIFERGKFIYVGPGKYMIAMPRSADEVAAGADDDLILKDAGSGKPFIFDYDRVKNPPVSNVVTQTSAFANTIGKRESGNDYKAENAFGYLGKYQMGAAALADAGILDIAIYRRAKDEGMSNKDILTKLPNVWKVDGGKAAFLQSPEMQERVFEDHTKRNMDALTQLGVIDDQTSKEDAAGYLAVAHLLGPRGAANYKKGINGKDGNGTSASTYFELGRKSVTAE